MSQTGDTCSPQQCNWQVTPVLQTTTAWHIQRDTGVRLCTAMSQTGDTCSPHSHCPTQTAWHRCPPLYSNVTDRWHLFSTQSLPNTNSVTQVSAAVQQCHRQVTPVLHTVTAQHKQRDTGVRRCTAMSQTGDTCSPHSHCPTQTAWHRCPPLYTSVSRGARGERGWLVSLFSLVWFVFVFWFCFVCLRSYFKFFWLFLFCFCFLFIFCFFLFMFSKRGAFEKCFLLVSWNMALSLPSVLKTAFKKCWGPSGVDLRLQIHNHDTDSTPERHQGDKIRGSENLTL